MGDKLRPKYVVQRVVGSDPATVYGTTGNRMLSTDPNDPDSPFVLMPHKDPAAFMAMLSYCRHCENDLAAEIRVWLTKIADAGPKYGSQGARNQIHMRKTAIIMSMES